MCRLSSVKEKNYNEIRREVFQRDGWRCKICRSRENLHAHHIVYRSHGGPNEDWNLCTVCNRCHDAIHAHKITLLPLDGYSVVDANMGFKISIAVGYVPGR